MSPQGNGTSSSVSWMLPTISSYTFFASGCACARCASVYAFSASRCATIDGSFRSSSRSQKRSSLRSTGGSMGFAPRFSPSTTPKRTLCGTRLAWKGMGRPGGCVGQREEVGTHGELMRFQTGGSWNAPRAGPGERCGGRGCAGAASAASDDGARGDRGADRDGRDLHDVHHRRVRARVLESVVQPTSTRYR